MHLQYILYRYWSTHKNHLQRLMRSTRKNNLPRQKTSVLCGSLHFVLISGASLSAGRWNWATTVSSHSLNQWSVHHLTEPWLYGGVISTPNQILFQTAHWTQWRERRVVLCQWFIYMEYEGKESGPSWVIHLPGIWRERRVVLSEWFIYLEYEGKEGGPLWVIHLPGVRRERGVVLFKRFVYMEICRERFHNNLFKNTP